MTITLTARQTTQSARRREVTSILVFASLDHEFYISVTAMVILAWICVINSIHDCLLHSNCLLNGLEIFFDALFNALKTIYCYDQVMIPNVDINSRCTALREHYCGQWQKTVITVYLFVQCILYVSISHCL